MTRIGTVFARGWTVMGRLHERQRVCRQAVVVTGHMPDEGDIVIDWESTLLGSLTDADGTQTLTIAQVIERLTTDLESGAEDLLYGLEAVVKREIAKAEKTVAHDNHRWCACGDCGCVRKGETRAVAPTSSRPARRSARPLSATSHTLSASRPSSDSSHRAR